MYSKKLTNQVKLTIFLVQGKRYMDTFNLTTAQPTYYDGIGDYDAKVEPSIQNEFATAAYRMGHSLIQGLVQWVPTMSPICSTLHFPIDNRLFKQTGQLNENRSFTLSGVLGGVTPFGKDPAWMDEALRGLITQPVQNFDSSFTPEITNKLFR